MRRDNPTRPEDRASEVEPGLPAIRADLDLWALLERGQLLRGVPSGKEWCWKLQKSFHDRWRHLFETKLRTEPCGLWDCRTCAHFHAAECLRKFVEVTGDEVELSYTVFEWDPNLPIRLRKAFERASNRTGRSVGRVLLPLRGPVGSSIAPRFEPVHAVLVSNALVHTRHGIVEQVLLSYDEAVERAAEEALAVPSTFHEPYYSGAWEDRAKRWCENDDENTPAKPSFVGIATPERTKAVFAEARDALSAQGIELDGSGHRRVYLSDSDTIDSGQVHGVVRDKFRTVPEPAAGRGDVTPKPVGPDPAKN